MKKVTPVLIDIVGIQNYVFSSNSLRDNLGASYLVQEVYKKYLAHSIKSTMNIKAVDLEAWWREPDVWRIEMGDFEVGYIGGGNALLFFTDSEVGETFVKTWTRNLLVQAPGLKSAVAISEAEYELEDLKRDFKEIKQALFDQLNKNKFEYATQTVLPRHGITAECSQSGYSMEVWDDTDSKRRKYVSSVTKAKIDSSRESLNQLNSKYKVTLGDREFTNDLEKLGQQKGDESYIAIVHIDGNDVGEKFKQTTTLEDMRNLSINVHAITTGAFLQLMEHIKTHFDEMENEFNVKHDGKSIVPLRPIIIGGDDITFVTDGRLGLYFAKIFLEAFEDIARTKDLELTACAGVAVTKMKYPFYRGYQLSEQLCDNAKEVRRMEKENESFSWLDFHLAYGGLSGTVTEIRERSYQGAQGRLCFRPYHISRQGKDKTDECNFYQLIDNTRTLLWKNVANDERNFPNSKIAELREVLTLGPASTEIFVQQMQIRDRILPEISGHFYHDSLFENGRTPYFDMVECMKLYPKFELDNKG